MSRRYLLCIWLSATSRAFIEAANDIAVLIWPAARVSEEARMRRRPRYLLINARYASRRALQHSLCRDGGTSELCEAGGHDAR